MIYLNTRADVYNYLTIDVNTTVALLQNILDDRFKWQVIQVLSNKEEGVEDETHMIMDSNGELLQSELQEDEN